MFLTDWEHTQPTPQRRLSEYPKTTLGRHVISVVGDLYPNEHQIIVCRNARLYDTPNLSAFNLILHASDSLTQ